MKILGQVELSPWKSGFYLRGGDVVRPLNGKWFGPEWPTKIVHFFMPIRCLPFLSVLVGKYGFYVGFKCFPVNHDEYRNWLPSEEVFEGSVALCPSLRFTNSGGV